MKLFIITSTSYFSGLTRFSLFSIGEFCFHFCVYFGGLRIGEPHNYLLKMKDFRKRIWKNNDDGHYSSNVLNIHRLTLLRRGIFNMNYSLHCEAGNRSLSYLTFQVAQNNLRARNYTKRKIFIIGLFSGSPAFHTSMIPNISLEYKVTSSLTSLFTDRLNIWKSRSQKLICYVFLQFPITYLIVST